MKNLIKKIVLVKKRIEFCRFGRAYSTGSYNFNNFFFKFMKTIHNKEFVERQAYLSNINVDNFNQNGFFKFGINKLLSDKSKKSLENLRNNFHTLNFDSKYQQKSILQTLDIKTDEDIINIIDDLSDIITKYMGCLPVVIKMEYWFSPNEENQPNRSQEFHTDGEDIKQVRVYIPVEEITVDHGPLSFIDAKKSYEIYKKLKKEKFIKNKTEKVPDEVIYKFLSTSEKEEATLKLNEAYMLDTCRCYHYGSRKSKYKRKLIVLTFQTPFSIDVPIFSRKINSKKFISRKHQLIYSFLEDNYYIKRDNYKSTRFKIKIQ
jgi:hypothetical protein